MTFPTKQHNPLNRPDPTDPEPEDLLLHSVDNRISRTVGLWLVGGVAAAIVAGAVAWLVLVVL